MAIKDGNIRPASTMSKEEYAVLLKDAEVNGYKNVGKHLLDCARIVHRLGIGSDVRESLIKPLV